LRGTRTAVNSLIEMQASYQSEIFPIYLVFNNLEKDRRMEIWIHEDDQKHLEAGMQSFAPLLWYPASWRRRGVPE